jgi:hypothetical protein
MRSETKRGQNGRAHGQGFQRDSHFAYPFCFGLAFLQGLESQLNWKNEDVEANF